MGIGINLCDDKVAWNFSESNFIGIDSDKVGEFCFI